MNKRLMKGKSAVTPTSAAHVATKNYVDSVAAGLTIHATVIVASTTNGTFATAFDNGKTMDGVTLVTGQRFLLKDQTSADENGVYIVQSSGAPSRATDLDQVTSGEVELGAYVLVLTGSVAAGTGFVTTTSPAVLDTNDWEWTQFSDNVNSTAAQIVSTPAGDLASTNVQDALDELDDEKASLAGDTFSGVGEFDAGIEIAEGFAITATDASADASISLVAKGTGSVNVNSKKITNVATPTSGNDGVNKTYSDLKAPLAGNNYSCGRMTFDGETVTIATVDVPVKIGSSTAVGDANGFTVGTDGSFTADYTGTKTCHLRGTVTLVSAANTINEASLDILVDGSSVFSSAELDIDSDGGVKIFEVDHYFDVAAGEAVTLGVTNGTDAENITVSAYTDRVDTAASSGFMTINTA